MQMRFSMRVLGKNGAWADEYFPGAKVTDKGSTGKDLMHNGATYPEKQYGSCSHAPIGQDGGQQW